jgi:hypothetical protein
MDNWKKYAGYTEVKTNPEGDEYKLFYLKVIPNSSNYEFKIDFHSFTLDQLTLTLDQVGAEVERVIGQFPTKVLTNEIDVMRARNDIAKESRRAWANTNFGNTWFYRGSNEIDCPIIVAGGGDADKYMVWKHPDFDKYGFTVVSE